MHQQIWTYYSDQCIALQINKYNWMQQQHIKTTMIKQLFTYNPLNFQSYFEFTLEPLLFTNIQPKFNDLIISIQISEFQTSQKMQPEAKQLVEDDHFPAQNQVVNASLVDCDAKTIHEKFNNYENIDREQRHQTVRNLPVLLQQLGAQGILVLKPLLHNIMKDFEAITKTLLDKLPELDIYLQKQQNYDTNIKNIIIPILIKFLNFNEFRIKEEAGEQLGKIAHKLNGKDRGDFVLKHMIEMAHDDMNQDNRIVAVQLFSNMSECFGKQLCEQYIGLEILSLGDDTNVKVRKQAIKHLPIISQLVSSAFFSNRFLTFYAEKAQDVNNWAIRKACIDIIIKMSDMCSNQQKEGLLSDLMLLFLRDKNKWVRLSAYKNLGKFIWALNGLSMNPKILEEYCRMPDHDISSIGRQNQIIYACAYDFPAVARVLGKEGWPELYRVYEKLLKFQDKKVKQSLSESTHEIAKIIGGQYTQKYLFRVIDGFFKQKNDQIKLGIIKNLASIMQVLSPEKRESLIGVFEQFQKDHKKWRIRECISKQLGELLEIYSPEIIFEYIVPILLKFCSDEVSIVREEAAGKVGDFIEKLSTVKGLQDGLVESIKAFGASPKYTQRQSYICLYNSFLIMCDKLMKNEELFREHFLPIFIWLKDDKVINVKLILAEIVHKHMQTNQEIIKDLRFVELCKELKEDPDDEINSVFQ